MGGDKAAHGAAAMTGFPRNPSPKQKEMQFAHQGGLCCWCTMKMLMVTEDPRHPKFATWEHVHPKSKGGTNLRSNRVLAHRDCNQKRGSSTDVVPAFTPYPEPPKKSKRVPPPIRPLYTPPVKPPPDPLAEARLLDIQLNAGALP